MTTTTEPGSALATRDLTLNQIARRIDLNRQSGWGLEKGTPAQLNLLALYCQRHRLLPGDEVTLYEGKPWITTDGRVTLMRRNRDEYRGHSQRPLSVSEKEAWGWDADDIVVETTVRTTTYGEIKAYGRVSAAERTGQFVQGVRHNPVAKNHPVEMAQKRSLSRAERTAFGTENFIDDEDVEEAARIVVEQRDDPERRHALVAKHAEIFGADEEDYERMQRGEARKANGSAPAEEEHVSQDQPAPPAQPSRADLWELNRKLAARAAELGLQGVPVLNNRSATDVVAEANEDLAGRIRAYEAGLNAGDADQDQELPL